MKSQSTMAYCYFMWFLQRYRGYLFTRKICLLRYFSEQRDFSSVQSLSRVWLFATPWTAACQASLSITNSWTLLKLMFLELVMPSKHLILCCPLLLASIFPSIRVFSNESVLHLSQSDGQSIGVSASASVLPMNIQDWFPLALTGLISLQSKETKYSQLNVTFQNYYHR